MATMLTTIEVTMGKWGLAHFTKESTAIGG